MTRQSYFLLIVIFFTVLAVLSLVMAHNPELALLNLILAKLFMRDVNVANHTPCEKRGTEE